MPAILIIVIVFAAAFAQSLTGFGFALVVMPLLTIVLGIRTAAPLVAVAALTVYTVNLARYRRAINISEVLRLGLASAAGVPVGIWLLSAVDEEVVMRILGAILLAYAAYSLLQPKAQRVLSRGWVFPAGFFAGCLGGAYNTPGPPVIVYGSMRQWPRDEFRAVLQALFFLNGVLVVASHAVAQHLTKSVLLYYLYAVPALAMGILLGSVVDRRIDQDLFRKIVTGMILALGLALLLGVG
ncbi:MAG: sulfite exporter TauE/SafE family protein [Anaerolineae bacterium]|jgi:hypothetical protein